MYLIVIIFIILIYVLFLFTQVSNLMIGIYNSQSPGVWIEDGFCATCSRWCGVVDLPSCVLLRLGSDVSNVQLLVALEYQRLVCVNAPLTLTDYSHLYTPHVQSPPWIIYGQFTSYYWEYKNCNWLHSRTILANFSEDQKYYWVGQHHFLNNNWYDDLTGHSSFAIIYRQ